VGNETKLNSKDKIEAALSEADKMPTEIKIRVEESVGTHLAKIRDYRICVEHYAPLAFGFGALDIWQHPQGWSHIQARIPDNPKAQSVDRYKFDGNLDALTYGIERTVEVVHLMDELVVAFQKEVEPQGRVTP
jgi:hypothetical protein